MPTGDYGFAYLVNRDASGDFTVGPQNPETGVEFNFSNPQVDPAQEITLFNAGNLDGNYDYSGEVTIPGDPSPGYVIFNPVAGQFYVLTNTAIDFNGSTLDLHTTNPNIDMPACFVAGTRIWTPTGEVDIENLRVGDSVRTSDGRAIPVRWVGRQTVSRMLADRSHITPVRVKAGALGDNVPCRDLLVSPEHALFMDGVLINAGALVNGTSIVRETDVPMTFIYYHVEVDDHSLILAENTPAETFVDNIDRMAFDNWNEYQALYPEGKALVEMTYPRAKSHRQVPQAVRERLAERSSRLFGIALSSAA